MSDTSITYLIAACAGVACLGLWVWLIAAPAWTSFSRTWERLVSVVLSVYVLAAMVGAGAAVGAGFLWYYDRIA